jgi:WD40 repeat protein
MALSHSGKQLAVGLQGGQVRLLDLDRAEWQKTLRVHAGPVQSVLFTSTDETIVSGGNDKAVIISDLEIGEKKMLLQWHRKQVRCLAMTADDTVLASSDNSGQASLWRAPRPAPSFDRLDRSPTSVR